MHKIVKIPPPIVQFPHLVAFFTDKPTPFVGKMTHTQEFLRIHTIKRCKKSSPNSHHAPHWPTQTPHIGLQTPQFSHFFLPPRRGNLGPKNCKIVSKNEKITPRPTPHFYFYKNKLYIYLVKLWTKKTHTNRTTPNYK